MEKGKAGEAYNIGGSEQITIKKLAYLMKRLAYCPEDICFEPHFIEDHNHRQPAVEKIITLGWRPKVNLRNGLRQMMATNGIRIEKPHTEKIKITEKLRAQQPLAVEQIFPD